MQLAFVRLMSVVPRTGLLIAGTESPALVEILPRARCRVETFGLHEGADWRATEVRDRAGRAHASGWRAGAATRASSPCGMGGRAQRPQRAGGAGRGRPRRASSPRPPARPSRASGA